MQIDTQERRRTLIVDRPVQRRIIRDVVVVPMSALAATSVVVAWFCDRLVEESLSYDIELPGLIPLLVSVLVFCAVSCFVIAVRGLRFSHRVAGPAYRICRSLERLRAGDTDFVVKLRKGDHLGEVAAELNRLIEHLRSRPANPAASAPHGAEQDFEPAFSTAGSSIPDGRG